MLHLFQTVGKQGLFFFREVGAHAIMFAQVCRSGIYLFRHRSLLLEQMFKIGVMSLPLVTIVSMFTGAVASWQAAYQFRGIISLDFLGAAVSAAILIELSPVLTGLVVAGRVGASIAAELGTMRVTEQIDALESMAIDPNQYLAAPRILAGLTMMPVLVTYSNLVAHIGGWLVANAMLGVSTQAFFASAQQYFLLHNVWAGLVKAFFFGGGTALIGCSIGFRTTGGAEGVGLTTIRAFVYSSAFILVADYILATVLF